MSVKKRILVDVDLTVVDLSRTWWRWLELQTKVEKEYPERGLVDYDLSTYFPQTTDPMDFWRNEGLYDMGVPIKGSVEALRDLSEEYNIFFASHCKGNHFRSKYRFLDRYFPFMEGFAATKEKYAVSCDIAIDDRNVFLNSLPAETPKLRFETGFRQDVPLSCVVHSFREWCSLPQIIKALETEVKS